MRSFLFLLVLPLLLSSRLAAADFDVKSFGAAGDGKALDTAAINRAIAAAHDAGGGSVCFPAGEYLSYSIHLQSNVSLCLGRGATIVAAEPSEDGRTGYDLPEPNPVDNYLDFGHTHWHNSLIWGENLENISIAGPGTIFGRGLSRGIGHTRRDVLPEERNAGVKLPDAATAPLEASVKPGPFSFPNARDIQAPFVGNKAIALKNCRNVILRDFTLYHGGHFAILATGVDNLTCDNVKIDTNRDGIDFDCCQSVRVSNCTVNSPLDDALCLKSTLALGYARLCKNITIANCQVSGYDEGTLLDGRRLHTLQVSCGRIKFGTEGNGGFKNITIINCVFDCCRGLALEEVDGGEMEDITIANLAMHEISNAPIFIRLGARLRGPGQIAVGVARRIKIENVVASDVASGQGILISGLPGHLIEDVSLGNILIVYRGGGTKEQTGRDVPEDPAGYPEPAIWGTMPSYGMFARHVAGLTLDRVEMRHTTDERRPAIFLHDVSNADFDRVKAQRSGDPTDPTIVLRQVNGFTTRDCAGLADGHRAAIENEKL
jgi:polygalacturonase